MYAALYLIIYDESGHNILVYALAHRPRVMYVTSNSPTLDDKSCRLCRSLHRRQRSRAGEILGRRLAAARDSRPDTTSQRVFLVSVGRSWTKRGIGGAIRRRIS